jgi:predicted RND superfamily exporter protein
MDNEASNLPEFSRLEKLLINGATITLGISLPLRFMDYIETSKFGAYMALGMVTSSVITHFYKDYLIKQRESKTKKKD